MVMLLLNFQIINQKFQISLDIIAKKTKILCIFQNFITYNIIM